VSRQPGDCQVLISYWNSKRGKPTGAKNFISLMEGFLMLRRYLPARGACLFLALSLFVLPFILGIQPVLAAGEADPQGTAELEAFFDQVIASHLESLNVPGAALAVVKEGELILSKGYGYADLESSRVVDPSRTLFRTGSVAKLFTWTAVMQQVEQGRLDLHADVNEYLDFTLPDNFAEPVTLAHLMTHTPGFEDVGDGLFVFTQEETLPLGEYLKQRMPARVFPPGRVAAYSNYGTALAGYIVERVSGEPFIDYVEEHIFSPLGMVRSTFRQPLPAELAPDMASGYGYHNGEYVKGAFLFTGPYPAGSMTTTAEDMAAFMLAYLHNGRYGQAVLLQPETVAQMQQRLYTPDPRLNAMAHGFMEMEINEQRILYHRGSIYQFNSGLFLLPDHNIGIFISYNGLGGSEAPRLLIEAFIDRFFPSTQAEPSSPPPGTEERVASFTGEYQLARAHFNNMGKVFRLLDAVQVSETPEGDLALTVMGRPEVFQEVEPGVFRQQGRENLLVFQDDAEGTTWLSLESGSPFDSFIATSAFRVPWYTTLSFTALLILSSLVIFLVSIAGWGIGRLLRRRRGSHTADHDRKLRWAAAAFGALFLLYLVFFVAIMGDIDPAYGMPRVIFREPPLIIALILLPWLMGAAAITLTGFILWSWLRPGEGGRRGIGLLRRFHFTLLAAAALGIMWVLWYWNLLALPG
jgi:CubicO group peptidase (beta-lactamase class C family)